MAIVYLCLGSNLGDRVGYIQQATGLIGALEGTKIVQTSSLYETQPWHGKETSWFVNAVIQIKSSLEPQDLLRECLRIEKQLGRNRETQNNFCDRTIDIDILFYDNQIISEDNLQVPHRFLHQRAFVLVPFLEINQNFLHPVLNKTVNDLYEELDNPEQVYLYGTRINGL